MKTCHSLLQSYEYLTPELVVFYPIFIAARQEWAFSSGDRAELTFSTLCEYRDFHAEKRRN